MSETKDSHGDHGGHHVPPAWIFHAVFVALIIGTVITYYASTIDMGRQVNIVVALAIAVVKASLVCAFFMHLRWDKPFNTVILLVSLGFTALFLGISTLDTAENEWRKDPGYAERKMQEARARQGISYERDGHGAKETGSSGGGSHSGGAADAGETHAAEVAAKAVKQFGVLPKEVAPKDYPLTDALVSLGQQLYWETRMSKSGTISCNSCHDLGRFGVDGLPTSPGHDGTLGGRNSPTSFNAALNVAGQFWDGRADSLEQQATMPITNPIEMGMESGDAVVAVLAGIPGYVEAFKAAFPGEETPLTFANVGKAIGAFERRLLTPSRFDAFMGGAHELLSPQELGGYETFVDVGCATCHTGPGINGGIEKLGKAAFFESKDQGVFEETGKERDRQMFKVPTLRNVTETGPWFHDGGQTDLPQVVRIMAKHQLGKELSDAQVADILAFLSTLTGELDSKLKAKPTLPQ